jgi:hypothetical protein
MRVLGKPATSFPAHAPKINSTFRVSTVHSKAKVAVTADRKSPPSIPNK